MQDRRWADKFGFDWPEKDGYAHVQVMRTTEIPWKGRKYRYLTIQTATDKIEVRISPKGQMRAFRVRKWRGRLRWWELKQRKLPDDA
jgi:hypothetical protein